MTDFAIETNLLRKTFGAKVAVAGLTLSVERGKVFGFLGPNGAGKTTSVKMLLGLIRPSSGTIRVLGRRGGDPQARARIGFLPEHFRFHELLTAKEFLNLHADLYRVPPAVKRQRIPDLLELVGLGEHAGKRLRTFSKGMLQRIGLAQALLNEPDLVILDEPTSGLDPVGRLLVRDIIRDLKQRGATVFLNSHLLSEIEVICDNVAFIKHGQVLVQNSLEALSGQKLVVQVRARPLDPETLAGLAQWDPNPALEGEQVSLSLASEDDLPAVNRYLVGRGVDVFAITPQKTSLEELFIKIVGTDGGL